MARTLARLFCITAALGWCAATAQAATFVPEQSTLMFSLLGRINLGGPVASPGTEGMVSLIDNGMGGHTIVIQPNVFSTVNYGAGTSLFTGVPLISDIRITARNLGGTFTSGFSHTNYLAHSHGSTHSVVGPYFGGQSPLSGKMILSILKIITYDFGLSPVGGTAGGVQSQTVLGMTFRVTHGPWVTGAVPVTDITTNVVSVNGVTGAGITLHVTPWMEIHTLSSGMGYVSTGSGLPDEFYTVTLVGSNQLLSASTSGTVMFVSPMRIDTSSAISGRLPGAAWMTLSFVPEPRTMLLLVTGAIGLAVIGRRRMRK